MRISCRTFDQHGHHEHACRQSPKPLTVSAGIMSALGREHHENHRLQGRAKSLRQRASFAVSVTCSTTNPSIMSLSCCMLQHHEHQLPKTLESRGQRSPQTTTQNRPCHLVKNTLAWVSLSMLSLNMPKAVQVPSGTFRKLRYLILGSL